MHIPCASTVVVFGDSSLGCTLSNAGMADLCIGQPIHGLGGIINRSQPSSLESCVESPLRPLLKKPRPQACRHPA